MKRLLTMFANRLLIKPSLRLLAAPDSRNVFSRLYLRWVKGVVGIGLPFLVKRLSIPFYSGAPLNNLVLFLSMELPTQRRQKQAAHGHSRFEYFSFLKDCLRHPAYQIPAFEHELGEIMEDASLQAIAISKIFSFETLFENREQEQAYSKFMSLVATRLADYVERECTPDLAARLRFYARFPCVSALDCCRPVAEALRRMERAVWKSAGILVDTPFDFVAPRKGGPLRVAFFRNDFRESGEVRQLLRTLDAMPETWEAYLIGFEDGAEASILEKLEARNVRRIVVDKSRLPKAVMNLRSLRLDLALWSTCLSGRFLNELCFLLSERIARRQGVHTGDVVTSGVANCDFFVVGTSSTETLQRQFTEKLLPVPDGLPSPDVSVGESGAAGPHQGTRFVSNAHLFKLNADLLYTWARVLKASPGSTLSICPYASSYHQRFERRLRQLISLVCKNVGVHSSRFHILSARGANDVQASITDGDIYLDSFPYNGSFSTMEALALQKPVVALNALPYVGTLSKQLLSGLGLCSEFLADSLDDYVARAVRLARDKNLRQKCVEKISDTLGKVNAQDRAFGKGLWERLALTTIETTA